MYRPVLEEGVEPLISSCALSANAITTGEGAVYLVNCLLALQVLVYEAFSY
jgi:hypothetical protein